MTDEEEQEILAQTMKAAQDFAAQFPHLNVKVTPFQATNCYAVHHDKRTNKGFTAAWYHQKQDGSILFKAWYEIVGDQSTVQTAADDLKKVFPS